MLDRVAALATSAEASNVQRNVVLGLGDGLKRSRGSLADVLGTKPAPAVRSSAACSSRRRNSPRLASPLAARQDAIQMLTFGSFADVKATWPRWSARVKRRTCRWRQRGASQLRRSGGDRSCC